MAVDEDDKETRLLPPARLPPPSHITLPPLPDSFQTPDLSPHIYYTAPSSPYEFYTPPTSPLSDTPPQLHISIPTPTPTNSLLGTDDPFPDADLLIDLAPDDAGLNTLEKIYLFARSKASFHRIYITHALQDLLHHVSTHEAVQYVLPLLDGLAIDEDEQVKEVLAAELVPLVWWFFTHCKVTSDDTESPPKSSTTTVSVQAFTPILGTLLLSSNPRVGGAARHAIVDLLLRLRDADEREAGNGDSALSPSASFDVLEREMLRTELLQQVVIGMGRLDMDNDDRPPPDDVDNSIHVDILDIQTTQSRSLYSMGDVNVKSENVNPYFPLIPQQSLPPPPSNSTGSTPSLSALESASSSPAHLAGTVATSTRKEPSPSPSVSPPPELHHTQSDAPWWQEQFGFVPTRHRAVSGGISMPLSPTEDTLAAATPQPDTAFYTQDIQDIQSTFDDAEDDEQAAVGRLSSMSLMAAVTASGTLGEETKEAFVTEVVRVAQDSAYWVRREASFALGALAKVVPEEIAIGSLLPLFHSLRRDDVWHVRHSALFALPAILSRLSANPRRSLAVDTILTLANDESSTVRCGVLEALGEVLYTFHEDEDGPPEELVDLFLGRREDRSLRDGQQRTELLTNSVERPLICAFNYPAVALTLGQERWGELRGLYIELSENRTIKVRRSLAASLGELAKIVGTENAERDLVGVWWDGIRCEDEEVRTRAAESLPLLVTVVKTEVGDSLLQGLATVWDERGFRGWREREGIAQSLVALAQGVGPKGRCSIVELVGRALEDGVAAVREAGVRTVAGLWTTLDVYALQQLRANVGSLAQSPVFKQRMTFIACQHALANIVPLDNTYFDPLLPLAVDPIDAVRIRLARLVASVPCVVSPSFLHLTLHLSRDPCPDVRAYLCHPASHQPSESFSTFSRPPPTNNASKDQPVALISVPASALSNSAQPSVPVDTFVSHDHHPISAIPSADIDGNGITSISPIPA